MRMKSKMKRIGAAALAALLTLSMSLTAFAAPEDGESGNNNEATTGTLRINAGEERNGAEFTIYPVMTFKTGTKADGTLVYTNVTVKDEFKKTIEEVSSGEKKGLDAISQMDDFFNQNKPSSEVAQLAADLTGVSPKPAGITYVIGNSGDITLPYGYYLIVETKEVNANVGVKSSPILVAIPRADGSSVTVNVKSSKPTIDKEIVEGDSKKSNAVAIGDTVKFKVTSDIPIYGPDIKNENITYIITDTLSKGLTYNKDLKISLDGVEYYPSGNGTTLEPKITETENDGKTELKVDLSRQINSEIRKKAEDENGAKFVFEYSATLNENASVGNEENTNEVKLTYEADHTTDSKATQTYTTSLKVIKLEKSASGAETTTPLSGATFKLQKKNGDVYKDLMKGNAVWTEKTVDDGTLNFNGLDAGDYKLIETAAPAGYGLDPTEREFKIEFNANNEGSVKWTATGSVDASNQPIITLSEVEGAPGTFETSIYNVKGISLPGTGGSGTTMFKVAGGALILLACGMLFVYYKKKGKESGK